MTHTITLRVTDEEFELIRLRADKLNCTVSNLLRTYAISGKPPQHRSRPSLKDKLHDPSFLRRLPDAKLRALAETDENAVAELLNREELRARLLEETRIDPTTTQRTPPVRKRRVPRTATPPASIPRRLQVNNPEARRLARYLATLSDDQIVDRLSSPDRALSEAAANEHERRRLNIRLFGKTRRKPTAS